MKTAPHAEAAIPLVPYRQAPAVLLLLAAAVLAITWPWVQTFSSAFLTHWDPPFHAWKLELVARAILSGHLVPPDGDTNMYYPHSGVLYFEALHWPQALVAAPLFLAGLNPVLVYHLVLVFFWALSGLCFWMLLLALGATRRAALLGALLFTLMPYRISYMVEFNMQLCFALPLFFFFMVRFFQQPSIRYACGLAVAWWLQAASELYQAVFLLLILPFPATALLAARWRLLGSFRRFWLPALCAATLGGALTWILLAPYLSLLNVHAVNRDLHEIATHILEPLSYLRPGGRFHLLAPFDARKDEMIVYPTLVVILLALAHLLFDARRLARLPAPRWIWLFRAIRWTALLGFFGLTFVIYRHGAPRSLAVLYALLPVVAVSTAFLVLLHPEERDTPSLFITGLFAGAVFAFFMSLGPVLSSRHSGFAIGNVLFLWIYEHVSALRGFRVVSRFSIYLLTYLLVAAAMAWTAIERRWLQGRNLRRLWIVPLLLALPECLPVAVRTTPLQMPWTSPVLDRLGGLDQPYVLAMLPMGHRSVDSRHMLQIAGTDRLFVYAWGGAYPRFTTQVRDSLSPLTPQPAETARLLRQLWPECFLLEDKAVSRNPHPDLLSAGELKRWRSTNYADLLSGIAEVFAEDERFVLLRLKPEGGPVAEHIRLVRRDLLVANPRAAFTARTPAGAPPATLWLDVNGYVAGQWEITAEPRDFTIRIPDRFLVPILPNRLRFHAAGEAPFFLDSFALAPVTADDTPVAPLDWPATNCPPWLGHVHQVPVSARPLNIHFPNGFSLVACEPLDTAAVPGGSLRLRHYVQCPRNSALAVNLSVFSRLCAPDGSWMEEGVSLAAAGNDLNDIRCQLHPAIYVLDQVVPIPERLVPGDYQLRVLVRDEKEQRLAGRQEGRRGKVFEVPVTIRIQAPAGP